MNPSRRIVCAILLAGSATLALAFDVGQLETRASVLSADYSDLITEAQACPRGDCENAAAILAGIEQADAERTALHADRATLDPCSTCKTLDATLLQIDQKEEAITQIIVEWDEQG